VPGQQTPFQVASYRIGNHTDQGVDRDGEYNDVCAQEFARIHGEESDPRLRTDGLGDNQREPRRRQRVAHACEDRGQRARKYDAPDHFERTETLNAPELDQLGVDLPDSQRGVDIDRKGYAKRNEKYLLGLTHAEPNDHKRKKGEKGDSAEHLNAAVNSCLGDPGKSDKNTERKADATAKCEAGCRSQQTDPQIVHQAPCRRKLDCGAQDLAWGRQDLRRNPTGLDREFPDDDKRDRREPGEQHQAAPADGWNQSAARRRGCIAGPGVIKCGRRSGLL
jgi:hypothetical protein